jgi:hypothetical protein
MAFGLSTCKLVCNNRKKQFFPNFQISDLERGEAVINNSLLAAARSRGAAGGPRCCGQGFFAYFLFPKKVREMAV